MILLKRGQTPSTKVQRKTHIKGRESQFLRHLRGQSQGEHLLASVKICKPCQLISYVLPIYNISCIHFNGNTHDIMSIDFISLTLVEPYPQSLVHLLI